ncbi:MAG: hypothetical protein IJS03_04470 [Eubacterium sp.]|nr:hypothetical protein [Eubacterium sp.]
MWICRFTDTLARFLWLFYYRVLRNPLYLIIIFSAIMAIVILVGIFKSKTSKTPEDEYYDSLNVDDD